MSEHSAPQSDVRFQARMDQDWQQLVDWFDEGRQVDRNSLIRFTWKVVKSPLSRIRQMKDAELAIVMELARLALGEVSLRASARDEYSIDLET